MINLFIAVSLFAIFQGLTSGNTLSFIFDYLPGTLSEVMTLGRGWDESELFDSIWKNGQIVCCFMVLYLIAQIILMLRDIILSLLIVINCFKELLIFVHAFGLKLTCVVALISELVKIAYMCVKTELKKQIQALDVWAYNYATRSRKVTNRFFLGQLVCHNFTRWSEQFRSFSVRNTIRLGVK